MTLKSKYFISTKTSKLCGKPRNMPPPLYPWPTLVDAITRLEQETQLSTEKYRRSTLFVESPNVAADKNTVLTMQSTATVKWAVKASSDTKSSRQWPTKVTDFFAAWKLQPYGQRCRAGDVIVCTLVGWPRVVTFDTAECVLNYTAVPINVSSSCTILALILVYITLCFS